MPATNGEWTGLTRTPGDSRTINDQLGVFVIHSLLLKNGNILMWSGHAESVHYLPETYEWDPTTDISTAIKATLPMGTDIFCCHHALLEDGQVLTVGGSRPAPDHGEGITTICKYNPDTHTWTRIGEMNQARWYPTLVQLYDDCFIAFSGRTENSSVIAETVELFSPPFEGPAYTTETLIGGDKTLPTYPAMHMIPGGKVVYSGPNWRYESGASAPFSTTFSFVRTGETTGAWIDEGVVKDVVNREEGVSVLLPPAQDGRILVAGGGFPNSQQSFTAHEPGSDLNAAEIIQKSGTGLSITRIDDMAFDRVNPNAVILPDGKVLVHGGHNSYKWQSSQTPSNQAELYDPVLDTWTSVASLTERRTYHSSSLLLADGRVFVAGGVDPTQTEPGFGPTSILNLKTLEFYKPPYFFNGPRPVINSISREMGPDDQIAYGEPFTIHTNNADDIVKVVLIKPGSMTHHTDSQQRLIPLSFIRVDSNTLRVGVVNDPSVAPPGIYMVWIVDNNNLPCEEAQFINLSRKSCKVVTDRSHFSNDALNASGATEFPDSFYVIMDGFLPSELGISLPIDPTDGLLYPDIVFRISDGPPLTDIEAIPQEILLEDSALPAGKRQRFTFKFGVRFLNNDPFLNGGTPVELQEVGLEANRSGYTCNGIINLINQPNPFMLDGATHWLSTDVRVFQITEGQARFGHTIGNNEAAASAYIQDVLSTLNSNISAGVTSFDSISTDQQASKLELSRSKGGDRVFNFAIAKVRFSGKTINAEDVRVFFRMFNTVSTSMEFNAATTYRTLTNSSGEPIPVLGLNAGEIFTIPFFAEPRVNTSLEAMTEQRDPTNTRTIIATATDDTYAFFGCFLDFNQTSLRFPLNPGGFGPYPSGLRSIQDLVRGRHQCLVAEVNFASDPILHGATPANNDNLSQRNLAIVQVDNPGSLITHTLQHSFELKASQIIGIGTDFKIHDHFIDEKMAMAGESHTIRRELISIKNDELMFQWHNVPRNSRATLFFPDIKAAEIVQLVNLKLNSYKVAIVDEHTISCEIQDVTYLPLPSAARRNIVGLLTIELPEGITKGGVKIIKEKRVTVKQDIFNVTVSQIDGMTKGVLGSFELVIPVSSAELILEDEMRYLAVIKNIALSIPSGDRWYPIFEKHIQHTEDRVRGFGADPATVLPSPDGDIPSILSKDDCCRWRRILLVLAILILIVAGLTAILSLWFIGVRIIGLLLLIAGIVGVMGYRAGCWFCEGE